MCSNFINNANSCYLDNFSLIAEVFEKSLVLGIIIGTMVGILLLFAKKIKG
jgi:hypothetical protein